MTIKQEGIIAVQIYPRSRNWKFKKIKKSTRPMHLSIPLNIGKSSNSQNSRKSTSSI